MHSLFEDFPVASAVRDAVGHGDVDFIPILGLVFLEIFIRPGHEVIPALQLRPANEDAAVGIRARTKLELEIEVIGKLLRGRQLRELPRNPRVHREHAVARRVTAVVTRRFAIEIIRLVTPSRQIFAVEQTDIAWFRFEIILRPR